MDLNAITAKIQLWLLFLPFFFLLPLKFFVIIWCSVEKLIGWPRYSHRMWPNEVYFSTYFYFSPLQSTCIFCRCCSAWIPCVTKLSFCWSKKVINSRCHHQYDTGSQVFFHVDMIGRLGQIKWIGRVINQLKVTVTHSSHWD